MGRTTSSRPPGRSVSGTLASLFVMSALAPAPAYAGVVNTGRDEVVDSRLVAAEQDCTVRFEYPTVGISEGIYAVLFVVMDTRIVNGRRRACYEGAITIQHEKFDNTEVEDYRFGGAGENGVRTLSFAPIQGQQDGTVAYGVDVREDNDDEDNDGDEDESYGEGIEGLLHAHVVRERGGDSGGAQPAVHHIQRGGPVNADAVDFRNNGRRGERQCQRAREADPLQQPDGDRQLRDRKRDGDLAIGLHFNVQQSDLPGARHRKNNQRPHRQRQRLRGH